MKNICSPLVLLAISLGFSANVYVDQVGYDKDFSKKAIVEGQASMAGSTFLVKQNGTMVFSGTLSTAQSLSDWSSQPYFIADFSALTTAGTYTLEVTENGSTKASRSFAVGANVITDATLSKLMDYFLADRADRSDVWAKDVAIVKYGDYSGKTYNVRGGWYDAAGDVSKYLSHLSYANYLNPQQTPMTVWTLAFAKERIPALLGSKGLTSAVQQEALWGADFLLRMLDADGYFYTTVFDGWTGFMADRQICSFTGSAGTKNVNYKAAFREGGGMAIAALARVSAWGKAGDSSSAAYLTGAERAYAHLKAKTVNGVCEYCDDQKENTIDDYAALMAAAELYKATKNVAYLEDARTRAGMLAGRISSEGFFYSDYAGTRPFWHAAEAGLPLVALTRYIEVEHSEPSNPLIKTNMAKHLAYLQSVTTNVVNPFGYARQTFKTGGVVQSGFFIPHDNESNYWWQGENARLASLTAAAFYAGRLLNYSASSPGKVPTAIASYGYDQLHWILGRNPKDMSFMQGVGQVFAPGYSGASGKAGHLTGGVVNGITGVSTDGTGLTYKSGSDFISGNEWESWRWTEQWLPHSTWFLMALATISDESPLLPVGISSKPGAIVNRDLDFHAFVAGSSLEVAFALAPTHAVALRLVDLKGQTMVSQTLQAGVSRVVIPLTGAMRGVHILSVEGKASRIIF
jgi:hypothetical protein